MDGQLVASGYRTFIWWRSWEMWLACRVVDPHWFMRIRPEFLYCGSGFSSESRVLMIKNRKKFKAKKIWYFFDKKFQFTSEHEILYFFLYLLVIRIQQLKLMRIHADPDPDPQPW
jgi:hypothetical protein